jgi:hypothetical protein
MSRSAAMRVLALMVVLCPGNGSDIASFAAREGENKQLVDETHTNEDHCAAFHAIHSQRDTSLQSSYLIVSAFNLESPIFHLLDLPKQLGGRYTMLWFVVDLETVNSSDEATALVEERLFGELHGAKLKDLNVHVYQPNTRE